MITPTEQRLEPLEDQVGDLFVNRQEELALFLNDWIARINVVPNNSWALIGRRRTGKTSVLVKLYNHLFYEQDRVMPVYISFARFLDLNRPLTMQEVGDHYMASYLLRNRCVGGMAGASLAYPALWHLAGRGQVYPGADRC